MVNGGPEGPEGRVALPDVAATADGVGGASEGPVDLAGLEAEIAAIDAGLSGPGLRAEVRRIAGRHGVAVSFPRAGERLTSGRILVDDERNPIATALKRSLTALGRSDDLEDRLAPVRREQAEGKARKGWSR